MIETPEGWQINGVQLLKSEGLGADQMGRTHILDYQMIETPEGWQINGVQLLKSEGLGA